MFVKDLLPGDKIKRTKEAKWLIEQYNEFPNFLYEVWIVVSFKRLSNLGIYIKDDEHNCNDYKYELRSVEEKSLKRRVIEIMNDFSHPLHRDIKFFEIVDLIKEN